MSDPWTDLRNVRRFLRLALARCMLGVCTLTVWGVACSDPGKQEGMDWGQTDYVRAGSVEVEPIYEMIEETVWS